MLKSKEWISSSMSYIMLVTFSSEEEGSGLDGCERQLFPLDFESGQDT